jgi:hypothetical protein
LCGQHHAPAAFIPGKDPVPIVQEAGWAPEPVWVGAENLAPLGFDPRTFQPVASCYTDYAIPAQNEAYFTIFNFNNSFSDDQSIPCVPEVLPRLFQLVYINSILAEHNSIAKEGLLHLGHRGRVFEPLSVHEGVYVGILPSSVFSYVENMQQAERLCWGSCRTTIIRYINHNNEKPCAAMAYSNTAHNSNRPT